MTPLLRKLLTPYMAPADGEGGDLPGDDYGDDFQPTGDDADTPEQKSAATSDGDADDGNGNEDDPDQEQGSRNALRDGADDPDDANKGDAGDDKKDTGTPRTGKGKFIPIDRHEKLLKKERARREEAEAQLAQGRAGQQVVKANDAMEKIENDLVALEVKYNDLLAEGDTKGAAAVMTQLRHKNAELNTVSAQQRDAEVMALAVEKVRYEEALERVEDAYPELNPESDEFDEDKMQDVVDLMAAGRNRGLSATKALQRAVQRVMGADDSAQRRATTVSPRVNESEVAAERRHQAVKRNLDASKRTPPASHRVTADAGSGKLTAQAVIDMSDADFAKLKEEDLAKLRGDTM